MGKGQEEIRCGQCGRLLGKGEAVRLAIKCPRCGTVNLITMSGKTAKP
jgi:phage FluMu protein Com